MVFQRYCGPKIVTKCCVLYGTAWLYDKSRLTLTTYYNP